MTKDDSVVHQESVGMVILTKVYIVSCFAQILSIPQLNTQ